MKHMLPPKSFPLLLLPSELLALIIENVFHHFKDPLTIAPYGGLVPHALLRTSRALRQDFLQQFLHSATGSATNFVVLVRELRMDAVMPLSPNMASRLVPSDSTFFRRRFQFRIYLSSNWRSPGVGRYEIEDRCLKFWRELRSTQRYLDIRLKILAHPPEEMGKFLGCARGNWLLEGSEYRVKPGYVAKRVAVMTGGVGDGDEMAGDAGDDGLEWLGTELDDIAGDLALSGI